MREKYNNYFRWGVTVISIIAFGILFFFFVFRMDAILGFLGKIFGILTPIILGAVIAYLINPLVTVTDKYIFSFWDQSLHHFSPGFYFVMSISVSRIQYMNNLWIILVILHSLTKYCFLRSLAISQTAGYNI